MKLLKEKIMSEGLVLNDAILKVDSFLNHQIDPELMMEIGKEFHRRFSGCGITKIFTIESSGIACALPAGLCMHVPVVFARKQKSALMSSEAYSTKVYSFTKKVTSDVTVLKKFLPAGEKILIIDDFLANAEAAVQGWEWKKMFSRSEPVYCLAFSKKLMVEMILVVVRMVGEPFSSRLSRFYMLRKRFASSE